MLVSYVIDTKVFIIKLITVFWLTFLSYALQKVQKGKLAWNGLI